MKPEFKITAILGAIILMAYPAETHAETQECDVSKPGLCRILGDLSSLLSSTNPGSGKQITQVTTTQTITASTPEGNIAALPTAAGETPIPLQSNNISAGEPQKAPFMMDRIDAPVLGGARMQPVINPQSEVVVQSTIVTTPRLSPDTKRLLRGLPTDIGNPERSSSPRLIDMQKGLFANDDPLDDEPEGDGAGTEVPPEPKRKPSFDISVEDVKTTENEISMLEKARKALLTGQYESSIALYKAVLGKLPRDRDALFGLATAYHRSGQRAQARVAYTALLTAYPQFQDGLNNFLVLASEEAPEDALAELNNLEARNPDFAPIHAQKAVIYSRIGQNNAAVASLTKALTLQPSNLTYKYNLAAIYDGIGNNPMAIKLYGEILDGSVHGAPLPVSRATIAERLTYLAGNSQSASN